MRIAYAIVLFVVFVFSLPSKAQIRNYKSIEIPGAYCGNGAPYNIYLSKKSTSKLAVEFMGGGACWSQKTCLSATPSTAIFPLGTPLPSRLSGFTALRSPIKKHSLIYFPYCTGDVFAGEHTALYENKLEVHHVGYSNVVKAIAYLKQNKLIEFEKVKDFVVYGSSAGAIASLVHAKNFAKELPATSKKTIIADAPGLHFGKRFWQKFTPQLIADYSKNFAKLNVIIDPEDGNIARQMPKMCKSLEDWEIGILQGSRDVIMSWGFGDISPLEHEELIYSKDGIVENTRSTDNCFVWVPKTELHTFLLASFPVYIKGMGALGFTKAILSRNIQHNYQQ